MSDGPRMKKEWNIQTGCVGPDERTGSSNITLDREGPPQKPGWDCFVATAVYGSYDCPEVVKLRGFRDSFLKKHALGRAFIAIYYRYGPYLAKAVKGRPLLSAPTKAALDLFIRTFLEKKRP